MIINTLFLKFDATFLMFLALTARVRVRVRVETVVTLRICTRVNPMKPDCSNGKYEKE